MNNFNMDIFNEYLFTQNEQYIDEQLNHSMLYSLKAGGKRIRPLLLFHTLDLFHVHYEKGFDYAAALEMIHTYSLIHDDLPSMDNDDYRRGKLTNHKVFGEATAILAGDALLTDSIHVIATSKHYTPEIKVALIALISKRAGSNGMVGGQMLDMNSENKQLNEDEMKKVHQHKTGDLITASIVGGGYIAEVDPKQLIQLQTIGEQIGLMFQIKDDILDVEGAFETIGKPVGSDVANQKSTYVSLYGLEASKQKLKSIYDETIQFIHEIQQNAKLISLVQYIVERDH